MTAKALIFYTSQSVEPIRKFNPTPPFYSNLRFDLTSALHNAYITSSNFCFGHIANVTELGIKNLPINYIQSFAIPINRLSIPPSLVIVASTAKPIFSISCDDW